MNWKNCFHFIDTLHNATVVDKRVYNDDDKNNDIIYVSFVEVV